MIRDRENRNEADGSVELWQIQVIDVPDLVNLIADFCDDESISKLSRVREKSDNRVA
jgi:hypothetical protein